MKNEGVLIYDFNDTGHCPVWLELCIRGFAKAGAPLTVAAVFENSEVSSRIGDLKGAFKRLHIRKKLDTSHLEAALKIAAAENISLLLFPNLDSIIYDLGKRGKAPETCRVRVAGIWLRPYLASRSPHLGEVLMARCRWGVKGKRSRRRLRTFRHNRKAIGLLADSIGLKRMTFFFTDNSEVEKCKLHLEQAVLRQICDPWSLPPSRCSKSEARRLLGLPKDRVILLHAGTARAEKGLDTLCEAFCELPAVTKKKLYVFRAGSVDWTAAGPLGELCESGCAAAMDRIITDEELSLSYAAADWVMLPYREQKESSGILVHAAAHSRPVVVSDYGLIGRWTRDFSLGLTYAHENKEALVALLKQLPEADTIGQLGMKEFASRHSPKEFTDTLLDWWRLSREDPTL